MIKLINPELFKKFVNERKEEKVFTTSFMSVVKTAVPNSSDGKKSMKLVGLIKHPSEDDFNKKNTRVRVEEGTGKFPVVKIDQSDDNKFDADVYFAAIPFVGTLVPIPESHNYRIYRGFVSGTERKVIKFDNERYNKVAYFIFSINSAMFNPGHKHHKDSFDMNVEAYSLDGYDENQKTIKTTWTITFRAGQEEPDVTVNSAQVDPIDLSEFKGQPNFPIWRKYSENSEKKEEKEEESLESDVTKVSAPEKKETVPAKKVVVSEPVENKGGLNMQDNPVVESEEGDDEKVTKNNPFKKKKQSSSSIGTPVCTKTLEEMIREANKVQKEIKGDQIKRNLRKSKKKKRKK